MTDHDDLIDKALMVLLFPVWALFALGYGLLVLYWLIRGKDWEKFPLL